jgi:hypothetical protein
MFDCQRVTFCKLNWCHSSPSWCAKSNTIPTIIILPKTNRPCRGYKTPAHTSKMGHIHRLSPRKLLLRSWKRPPVYDLGSGDGAEKSHWVEVSSRALKCLLLRGLDHEYYWGCHHLKWRTHIFLWLCMPISKNIFSSHDISTLLSLSFYICSVLPPTFHQIQFDSKSRSSYSVHPFFFLSFFLFYIIFSWLN